MGFKQYIPKTVTKYHCTATTTTKNDCTVGNLCKYEWTKCIILKNIKMTI